ncbi:hypothetical protein [Streptomyces hygroscopicus]|uniref:hypothetical protein n=1 Tax=Streptomyces hygroscopicus TaxID=1912 RepID=UPI00223ECC13|nr:hypothetical protein [Streptomyces hygroscopicus]
MEKTLDPNDITVVRPSGAAVRPYGDKSTGVFDDNHDANDRRFDFGVDDVD